MGQGRWTGEGEKDCPGVGRHKDRKDERTEISVLKRRGGVKTEVVKGETEGTGQGEE